MLALFAVQDPEIEGGIMGFIFGQIMSRRINLLTRFSCFGDRSAKKLAGNSYKQLRWDARTHDATLLHFVL